MRTRTGLVSLSVIALAALANACLPGCDQAGDALPADAGGGDASDAARTDAGGPFCALPGSLVFDQGGGSHVVAGGRAGAPDLGWLKLPPGYCAHWFGTVPAARQIRFAPGGELFVASPSTFTAGGAPPGAGQIVLFTDDDHDGYADGNGPAVFLGGLPSTQGILFTPGWLYYQDHTRIVRVPYQSGDRVPRTSTGSLVADITIYQSSVHWPKTMDVADDGTIYVGNGGDQGDLCDPSQFPRPFHGGVLALDGSPGGTPIAQGFRNPYAIKCQRGHDHCFTTEMVLDGSGGTGGREKVVPIRKGDDWGFPCCATTGVPYAGISPAPNCASVATDTVQFVVGHSPFGIDFAPRSWPSPFAEAMLVSLHGVVGSWQGARVVAVATGADGMPVPTSELQGGTPPVDFATGWDDGRHSHGRPADVTFSADGRAFLANDFTGDILWFAPVGL